VAEAAEVVWVETKDMELDLQKLGYHLLAEFYSNPPYQPKFYLPVD